MEQQVFVLTVEASGEVTPAARPDTDNADATEPEPEEDEQ